MSDKKRPLPAWPGDPPYWPSQTIVIHPDPVRPQDDQPPRGPLYIGDPPGQIGDSTILMGAQVVCL